MPTITISREDLLKRLREAKARAEYQDVKAAKKHKADEAESLQRFRDLCRKAMKWDYRKVKAQHFSVRLFDTPSCPYRLASKIERAIREVNVDSRKEFRLSTSSDWFEAATWVPDSERPKSSVCD